MVNIKRNICSMITFTMGYMIWCSSPGRGWEYFTTASKPALGPTELPIQWIPGALSLGVKRPGREADHSPPSSAEVKEWVELYLHSFNTPSWRGAQFEKTQGQLYLYRLPFTFTLNDSFLCVASFIKYVSYTEMLKSSLYILIISIFYGSINLLWMGRSLYRNDGVPFGLEGFCWTDTNET
jgi:hypothetical protein